MSAKNFKFVSPGVFLNEIDQSRLPTLPEEMGPCIIGTTDKGPAFRPVMVESVEEFINIFGAPSMGVVGGQAGNGGQGSDIFRAGPQSLGVDYGALAAIGYLEDNAPVTFIRVLGSHDPNATGAAQAGWSLEDTIANPGTVNQTGGSYGLFATTQTGLDSIRIPVLQTAVAAASHVVEITIPAPAADTAMDAASVFKLAFRAGKAIGPDDLIIETAADAITHAAAAVDPQNDYATAIAAALTAGLPNTFNGGGNAATAVGNKVTITGPVNGDQFELVLIDEPTESAGTALVNTPVAVTTQGSGQGAAPAGVLLKFKPTAVAQDDIPVTLSAEVQAQIDGGLPAAAVAGLIASEARRIINANTVHASIFADGSDLVITPSVPSKTLEILDKDGAQDGLFADLSTALETASGQALTVLDANFFTVTFGAAQVLDQGRLAAIFHATTNTSLRLGTASTALGSIVAADPQGNFSIFQVDENGAEVPAANGGRSARFSLAEDFRSKFDKNPTLLNAAITDSEEVRSYFLAESFEGDLEETFGLNVLGSNAMRAVLVPLVEGSDFRSESTPSSTPWILGQSMGPATSWSTAGLERLFKIEALDTGDSGNKYKVSIGNIKVKTGAQRITDPFCTFDVRIHNLNVKNDELGTDGSMSSGREFTNVNLNPRSQRFIGRVIGDQRYVWSPDEGRLKLVGSYKNRSSNFRVVLSDAISNGTGNPDLVPSAYVGPQTLALAAMAATGPSNWNSVPAASAFSARGPSMPLKKDQADQTGAQGNRTVYFGVDTHMGGDQLDLSYSDVTRKLAGGLNSNRTSASFVFSLELLKDGIDSGDGTPQLALNGQPIDAGSKLFYYDLTGRDTVGGAPSPNGEGTFDISETISSQNGMQAICDRVGGFVVPMTGGFDGFDILSRDPISEYVLSSASSGLTSSPYYTIEKAIRLLSDPEFIECNMMAVPGVVHEGLTNKLISTAERRGDALAVIDLPDVYYPKSSRSMPQENRAGTMRQIVSALKTRGLASSYGCAYAPWLQVSYAGNEAWVPPSTIAIPTMGKSEKTANGVWFAPAGFNRGGLNNLLDNIVVQDVSHNLTSKERDDLYEQYVNPIASFPNEDIVIFGQKTLQGYASALDRINVRRLLIHVKKRVAQLSMNLLFEPNISSTWLRFSGPVDTFLSGIKAGGGLVDYRVILDETTTTPDLIDRNIMYAKILLKPTRAIEFIALDFVVTNTGVSVND